MTMHAKINKLVLSALLLVFLSFATTISASAARVPISPNSGSAPTQAGSTGQTAVSTDPAACGQSIKACCDTNSASTTGDKPSDCGFIKRINDLITFLSVIVGIACALGIIIGGIEYSMSGGDPKRAASGKDHITKAVIAVVLYGFLYFFLQFIVPGGFLNG